MVGLMFYDHCAKIEALWALVSYTADFTDILYAERSDVGKKKKKKKMVTMAV